MNLGALHGRVSSVQRGFALIALLALAALISAFLIASALNLTSAGISNEREDRSMGALRKAKAALIAHAASEQWQLYKSLPTLPPAAYFQPGALPCPDLDNDGDADCAMGSSLLSMIGRVPYKTMGIDDLRDASGERIWYALSHDFRKNQCPGTGCTTINSDTLGQLTVTGTAPATQVVAIVFAPGAPLDLRAVGGPLQNRIAGPNDPTNYLENFNPGDSIHFTFTSTGLATDTSNDRLLVITQADLMAAVEPVVAARIERDIKPLLQNYFTKWGAYPFAAPFNGPDPGRAQSEYKGTGGVAGLTNGLLPLTNDPNWFRWTSAIVTQLVGHPMQTGSPTVTSSSCTINTSPSQAVCQVNYQTDSDDRPVIKLDISLTNWNTAFADFPSPFANPITGVTMTANPGGTVTSNKYGYWSFVSPDFPPPLPTFVAQGTGNAILTYVGRLQNSDGTNHGVAITIPLPTPAYLPVTSGNSGVNPSGAWFISNQWYRQTYYAVSPGFAPGGVPPGATCIPAPGTPSCCNPLPTVPPTPSCLTVNNLRPVAPASCTPGIPSADPCSTVNKQALLILAGRALNGVLRPTGNVADYLENANLTAANGTTPFVYEHRAGVPTAINDRVVVVSPP